MLSPSEMIEEFRNHLDAVGSNFFSGAEVARRLFDAQQDLCRLIVQADPSFFVATYDISLVANQDLYDLPLNARLGTRMIFAENRISGSSGVQLSQSELRDYFAVAPQGALSLTNSYSFFLEGAQVRISPTPTVAAASAVRVWYNPSFGNMLEGSVASATSTTLTTYSSDPNYTTTFGKVNRRTDYYRDMPVTILSGTGVGESKTITAWNGSSRVMTVDSAWSATPDSTSKFAVLCPVPEDFHHLVPLKAALIGAVKNRNRGNDLWAQVYGAGPGRPGELSKLLAWVDKRQDEILETVTPTDLGDY